MHNFIFRKKFNLFYWIENIIEIDMKVYIPAYSLCHLQYRLHPPTIDNFFGFLFRSVDLTL